MTARTIVWMFAGCAFTTSAQNNYSQVLDTAGTNNYPRQFGILCSDGANVLASLALNGTLLRRTDASGNLVWNKFYPDAFIREWQVPCTPLAADDNGGFYMAHTPVGEFFASNIDDPDTTIGRVVITHVASNGSVLWRTDLERTVIGDFMDPAEMMPALVSIAVHDADRMYVLVEHDVFVSGTNTWQLLAMAPSDGTVQWQREVTNNGSIQSNKRMLKAVCLPNGDVVLGCNEHSAPSDLLVARVNYNGDLLWMNDYRYDNAAAFALYHDLIVTPSGTIVGLGWVDVVMSKGFVLYHLNGNGTLDHGELVEEDLVGVLGQLVFAPGTGFVVALSAGTYPSVIHFGDTMGGAMERHKLFPSVVGANEFTTSLRGLDVMGPQILLTGALRSVDNQFGTATQWPVIMHHDAQTFAHCLDSVSTRPRSQIPSGAVATLPCSGGTSVPPPFSYVPVSSPPTTLVDVPSVATMDLCDVVISTGELLPPDPELHVWPVPASVGTALWLMGAEQCHVTLLDAQCRVVHSYPPAAAHQRWVDTSTLLPGAYLLRCTTRNGTVRTARVLLN